MWLVLLLLNLPKEVVDDYVGGEGDDCDAETWEHAAEHGPI